jgi:hypothetical protein
VEAFQIIFSYPQVITNPRMIFTGTIYENFFPDPRKKEPDFRVFQQVSSAKEALLMAVVGSNSDEGFGVPPGSEVVVAKIRATISADAEPGTTVPLELTNGPDGSGWRAPYNLRNELTFQGSGRMLSVRPTLIPGRIAIVDDITFFLRGDANGDQAVDVSDAIYTLDHLFLGGRSPRCPDAEDADDNGRLELTDAVVILGQLFLSDARIAEPYPAAGRDGVFDNLSPCH